MTIPIKIIRKSEYDRKFGKPNQEKVWDEIAGTWSKYRNKTLPVVEEFLKDKKGKVIDLGCGSGRNMIANPELIFYEIDFSEKQIILVKKRAEELEVKAIFLKECVDKLPKSYLKNNMFDYGLFIATLHCMETAEKRENSLKEFYRVLKPGAEALISIWNSEDKRFDDVENHGDIYMSWKINNKEHMRYYYLFSKDEFIKLIKNVGFEIIEFYNNSEDRFSRKNWIIKVKKI